MTKFFETTYTEPDCNESGSETYLLGGQTCEKCHDIYEEEDSGAFCVSCSRCLCKRCVYACSKCNREGLTGGTHYTVVCEDCPLQCSWHRECRDSERPGSVSCKVKTD